MRRLPREHGFDAPSDSRKRPVQFAEEPVPNGPLCIEDKAGGETADFPSVLRLGVPIEEHGQFQRHLARKALNAAFAFGHVDGNDFKRLIAKRLSEPLKRG